MTSSVDVPNVVLTGGFESFDMTVGDICAALQSEFGVPIVAAAKADQIVRGSWDTSVQVVRQVALEAGLTLRKVDDTFVLVDAAESLHYVRWASGRTQTDAQSLLDGLGLASVVVDRSGVAYLGVKPSEEETIKSVLVGLDAGDDWLVQITIVDGVMTQAIDGSVSEFDAVQGGWTVTGSDVVDSFLITAQSGQPRIQRFGSQVPFRTSVVNETGVVLTGGVQYQDIETVMTTEVVEAVSGPKMRVSIDSRRPGTETDGLFEIIREEIDTEVFIRAEPVLIGSLQRWGTSSSATLAWPFSALSKSSRSRKYQVWLHAVRLPAPPKIDDLLLPEMSQEPTWTAPKTETTEPGSYQLPGSNLAKS
ncbi:MAG: hypothetical protein AAFN77_16780 [Planctomycetota bacterium]